MRGIPFVESHLCQCRILSASYWQLELEMTVYGPDMLLESPSVWGGK